MQEIHNEPAVIIAHASLPLTRYYFQYSTSDLDLLSVALALTSFNACIIGKPITIYTASYPQISPVN
jgi:hypothetical protein